MLSHKQSVKTVSWANPLWWDNFMNKIILSVFYLGMTSSSMYM